MHHFDLLRFFDLIAQKNVKKFVRKFLVALSEPLQK